MIVGRGGREACGGCHRCAELTFGCDEVWWTEGRRLVGDLLKFPLQKEHKLEKVRTASVISFLAQVAFFPYHPIFPAKKNIT